MAVQYAPLFALETQFQAKNGRNLTGGFLRVFYAATDDPADTYSDYNLTRNPDRIVLDDNGRALVICDKSKAYRLEVYDINGMLLWTEEPVFCSGSGGAGMSSSTDIISTDGTIVVEKSTSGSSTTFDIGLGVDKDRLNPSCLSANATPRNSDGKFVFGELSKEGDLLSVDNYGCVRCEPAWYHFTAIVELSYGQVATNSSHQITLYTTLSNSVIDFDLSYAHRESIELSGDIHVVESNSEFVLGVTGLPNGVTASIVDFDIHAITGHEQSTEYSAGNGINIADHEISADFDVVQHKLTAGNNITITGNVISAENLSQEQADWTQQDSSQPSFIKHKPDLDVFATKTEVNTGLAGKQDVISDLSTIRSGAQAGASAVQPSDLAAVATTGDYNSLNNRPNLTVYATKTEVNTGLAAKQDVISDLATIRSGAAAGATAVQPADLNAYATDAELAAGLATKQDVLTPGDNITISNNVISATDQRQADWAQGDSSAVDYIRNKPDLSTYATDAELAAGLATKQGVINDLDQIRSGASAGSTALQPSDVATVATTGDYDDLSDKPDLSVYATTSAMNTALAGKQDTISDLSTIRSGAAAGATAIQPGDLATVATTGSYDDLSDKPTIPAAQVNSDWNSVSGVSQILNKPSLAAVATTGDYDDLINKPSIPAAQVNADWNASSGVAEILNKPANLVQDANYVHTDENFTSAEKTKLSGIAAGAEVNVQADWTESDSSSDAYIANKPALATVATTGAYSDLTGTPTIPTVSDNVAKLQYGVATYAQVVAAFNAGKSIYLYNGDTDDGVVSSDITFGDDGAEIIFSRHNVYGAAGSRTEYKVTSSNVWSTTTKSVAVPTVDQSYSSSSANAQSGVAVAQAIAAIPSSSYTAGTGIDITNNVVSVDNTVVAMKSDLPTATSDLTNDSGFITLHDVPAQVNADWNSSSGASEILNKPTIPSGNQLVPAATSADADKVLTVDAQGIPGWAAGGTGGGNVFMATSTTTFPELWQAFHEDGKIVYCTAGSASSLTTPYFLQTLKSYDSSHTTGTATFVQFNQYSTGRIEVYHATVTFSSSHPTLGTVTFTRQVVVPDNPGSHVGEYLTAQSNGNMTFATVNQVPASTSADADKVLTVDSQGTPAWSTPAAGGVTDVEVDGASVVSGGVASITMPTVDQTYNSASTDAQSGVAVAGALSTKQDTISDLATIRSGAQLGSTAVQPGDLSAVAMSGDYSDLSNTPTIPAVPTAGNMLSVTNNVLDVTTTAGITDVQLVNALPAQTVASVVYLIPET